LKFLATFSDENKLSLSRFLSFLATCTSFFLNEFVYKTEITTFVAESLTRGVHLTCMELWHIDFVIWKKMTVIKTGTGATFDWTFFDNWNRRKELWRVWKVAMFDSDLVRRGSSNCRRKKRKRLSLINVDFD